MAMGAAERQALSLAPAALVEPIVREHGNFVFQIAYRMTGCSADAEDILQTTFLKFFAHSMHLVPALNRRGWLTRVAANASIDLLRARKSRGVSLDPEACERIPDAMETPPGSVDRRELADQLRLAMDTLPPRQLAALLLYDREGLTSAEVGKILGVPASAVRSYVFEARRKVKERLTPYLRGSER